MRARLFTLVVLALVAASAPAYAHKPSDSYLTLRPSGRSIGARWDIALRDIDYALSLDSDGDGAITWGELRAGQDDLARWALAHLTLSSDGAPCTPSLNSQKVVEHSDGSYAVLELDFTCAALPRALSVDYRLLFDLDPQHRGLLHLDQANARSLVFSADTQQQIVPIAQPQRLRQLASYIGEGVRHIASGYDHLLFLIALLLPAVLRRERAGGWAAVAGFRAAGRDALAVVTAFTLAHSITLSLAALGVVALPARFVESAIAASVVVAALNNIWPLWGRDRWGVAFALGLLHGFGFSATLLDLGLPQKELVPALFGFNLGVELGQFVIVAAFLPLAFALRNTLLYRRVALLGGSALIGVMAAIWFCERAFLFRVN